SYVLLRLTQRHRQLSAPYISMARMEQAAKELDLTEIELDALEFELVALKALFADLDARVHPENYPSTSPPSAANTRVSNAPHGD
ncbi:MAG: hypothetical protein MZV65_38385, partial [Chromatiales bacterium]|nr:hypothetical protein [Chromatiales bacterium]